MAYYPNKAPKYQRCTLCDWRGTPDERLSECPDCGGFLILKSTQNRSKTKVKKVRGPKSDQTKRIQEDGFRLHRNPKGNGWVFIEGRSPKSAPAFLSNEDAQKINACAARRGLIRSRVKKVENND